MPETKPYQISKNVVAQAFEMVKANRGTYGVDKESIEEFEMNKRDNLYKIWNRMSSGSYLPKPVKAVAIPKKTGGTRILGIPTVEDRVAQTVAKQYFEPGVERIFYEDSYGYRPNKSAIQAVEVTRQRCWRFSWVLEFDIKGLFDNIRHDYLMALVKRHTQEKWLILYIERWLKTPFQMEDGTLVPRDSGTPQGGVISPVLANLFLHYTFDNFMMKQFPSMPWARYADDGIIHCMTLKQAQYLQKQLQKRFEKCGLELNLEKTKIVYCKDSKRREYYPNTSFDFLGYTFRPRTAESRFGEHYVRFLPAISDKAKKAIRHNIRSWGLQRRVDKELQDIAEMYNSRIQGWINYYSHFYKSELGKVLRYVNQCLVKWVQKKYKISNRKAIQWIGTIARNNRNMFAHWKQGIINDWIMGAV